jgi:hypothetical protein
VGDPFVSLAFASEGDDNIPGAFSLDSFFLEASVDSEREEESQVVGLNIEDTIKHKYKVKSNKSERKQNETLTTDHFDKTAHVQKNARVKQNESEQKYIHLLSVCASHNALVANSESNSSFTSETRSIVTVCVCVCVCVLQEHQK